MASLLIIVFVNFIGIGALIPVLPFTVVDQFGYSATVMTALLASFSLAMFIANPVLGRLSDRYGRKPILVSALAVNMAAHIWFALSDDIVSLFIARILAGLAAGNIGVIQAIITDSSSPDSRAKIMGMLGAAIGAGFVLGPALGGVLSSFGTGPAHQVPFLVAAGFAAFACLLATRLRETAAIEPSSHPQGAAASASKSRQWQLLLRPSVLVFAVAFFCLNLSFAQVEATHVLLLRDLLSFDAVKTGWFFAYIGVMIIIVQGGLIGRLVARYGERTIILCGIGLLCVGQILTATLASSLFSDAAGLLAYVVGVTALICVGFALTNPTLSAASSHIASETERGSVLGVVQGCGSLGQVFGLTLAGPFYQLGGGTMSFGFGALITAILLVLIVVNASIMRSKQARTGAF